MRQINISYLHQPNKGSPVTFSELINVFIQGLGIYFITYLSISRLSEIHEKYFTKVYRYDIHIPVAGSKKGIRIDGTYRVTSVEDAIMWCKRLVTSMHSVEKPTSISTAVKMDKPYEVVRVNESFKFVQDGRTFLICYPKRKFNAND